MDGLLVTGADGFIGSHFVHHMLTKTDRNLLLVCGWRRGGMGERLRTLASVHSGWRDRVTVMTHDLSAPFSSFDADRIEDLLQFQTIFSKPLGQDRLDILERTR